MAHSILVHHLAAILRSLILFLATNPLLPLALPFSNVREESIINYFCFSAQQCEMESFAAINLSELRFLPAIAARSV